MIGTPIAKSVLQERNGQENSRVYDPTNESLLIKILKELQKVSTQLSFITGEEL